jgi:hypothetical protein
MEACSSGVQNIDAGDLAITKQLASAQKAVTAEK